MHEVMPDDPAELVHNGCNLEITGEAADNWRGRPLFKISGISDALKPLGLRRSQVDAHPDLLQTSAENVPQSYRDYFRGEWTNIGGPQVTAMCEYKNQTVNGERIGTVGRLQILDRAFVSLNYLCHYTQRRIGGALPADFLAPIKIVPVLWTVEVRTNAKWNGDDSFWETRVAPDPDFRQRLNRAIRPNPAAIVAQALQDPDRPVRLTYRNAYWLNSVLLREGFDSTIQVPPGRAYAATNFENLNHSRRKNHPPLRVAV